MADFEVATGAIFTGGVSHCCPTVQVWSSITLVYTVFTLILQCLNKGISCKAATDDIF